REAIGKAVPHALTVLIHQAAARYYGQAARLPAPERQAKLAFHAAGAGLRGEAGRLSLAVAERARQRHAYLEAESEFSRALEYLGESDERERLTAWKGRGVMRYRMGRYEDSLNDFRQA